MQGLNILLYGWITGYCLVNRHLLGMRNTNDNGMLVSPSEVQSLSLYVGYDLTKEISV